MQAQQYKHQQEQHKHQQEQHKHQQEQHKAYIPKAFAIFCTLYFYGVTLGIITLIALVSSTVGRDGLLPLLPLLALAAPCLWLYGHWVRLARHNVPVYEITGSGVIDRASFPHGTVLLPFENIAQTKQTQWCGFNGLAFVIKDKAAFYQSLGRRHRFLARLNEICYGSPFVLWQAWSDVPMTDLQHEIQNKN
jgi:hypothetical protein